MLKTETITINGKEYTKNYSDSNHKIIQNGTNTVYDEAIDPIDTNRTYTESEELIESIEEIENDEANVGET